MQPGAYPTPAQVSVFLKDVWLDDAYRVEIRRQNHLIPLYGYNQSEFTHVAQGKKIVQGSLIINYRYPEYLRAAIEGSGQKRKERDAAIEMIEDIRDSSVEDRIKALEEARQLGRGRQMKTLFRDVLLHDRGEEEGPYGRSRNLELQAALDTHPSEDLTLKIFFDMPGNADYHLEVIGVRLVGQAMTISNQAQGGDASASGMPIYEVYSFFARRVVPVRAIQQEVLPQADPADQTAYIDTSGYVSPEERNKVS